MESVEAIEMSSPQTTILTEGLYLDFVALFLRSEAPGQLAGQRQLQFLNEHLCA